MDFACKQHFLILSTFFNASGSSGSLTGPQKNWGGVGRANNVQWHFTLVSDATPLDIPVHLCKT